MDSYVGFLDHVPELLKFVVKLLSLFFPLLLSECNISSILFSVPDILSSAWSIGDGFPVLFDLLSFCSQHLCLLISEHQYSC
jgi:hypothetical protein